MELQTLKNKIIEEGYKLTNNIFHGIWILTDGTMIDGDFEEGYRNEDHRMIETITESNKDRYDNDFWDVVTKELNIVMIVPETKYILLKEWQEITKEQQIIINELVNNGYEIENY